MHEGVLNKQAKKFRDKMIKDMYYYGLKSHEDVAKEIEKLSANTSGTIIYSTFFRNGFGSDHSSSKVQSELDNAPHHHRHILSDFVFRIYARFVNVSIALA